MNLDWSDEYNTGIREIDYQHKSILDLMKNLSGYDDPELISLSLNNISRYITYHLGSIETLMMKSHYPQIFKTQESHQSFLISLDSDIEGISGGKNETNMLVMNLFKWFTSHIEREDKEFGQFLSHLKIQS